jgi:hypothetical protein
MNSHCPLNRGERPLSLVYELPKKTLASIVFVELKTIHEAKSFIYVLNAPKTKFA